MGSECNGQVSVDFMLSLGIALILLIALVDSAISQETHGRELMAKTQARNVLEDMASAIDSVYLAGENATREHVLPETLPGGIDYTVKAYPRSLLLTYSYQQDKQYSRRILPANINGSAFDGSKGPIRITNVGGTIYLQNGQ